MRIVTLLLVGCFAGMIGGMASCTEARAQEADPHMAMMGRYARKPPVYPEDRTSWRAYLKAIKYGLPPVLPPAWTRGPLSHDGRGLYGPPYYAYPRPALGYQGYAGFSGDDPDAYHAVIPPPIPPAIPREPADPKTSAPPPSAPMPPAEPVPTPVSEPVEKR
jgi:hypothetical protein